MKKHSISIELSEPEFAALSGYARELGVTPEQLAWASFGPTISARGDEDMRAAILGMIAERFGNGRAPAWAEQNGRAPAWAEQNGSAALTERSGAISIREILGRLNEAFSRLGESVRKNVSPEEVADFLVMKEGSSKPSGFIYGEIGLVKFARDRGVIGEREFLEGLEPGNA